jgi:hypothetical protein
LDANEGSTKLNDSIFAGAEMIEEDIAGISSSLDKADAARRIFLKTDCDDNASKRTPWQVSVLAAEEDHSRRHIRGGIEQGAVKASTSTPQPFS